MAELAAETVSGYEEYATYIDDFDSSSCELTANQGNLLRKDDHDEIVLYTVWLK